jgi:hypothetical protein
VADKVYCRGPVRVEHAGVVRQKLARWASDHLPLVVRFLLLGDGGMMFDTLNQSA